MEPSQLSVQLTVAELLARWPAAAQVFLRHRMACVGCEMSAFQTLGDAAAVYRIPVSELMAEMQEATGGQNS